MDRPIDLVYVAIMASAIAQMESYEAVLVAVVDRRVHRLVHWPEGHALWPVDRPPVDLNSPWYLRSRRYWQAELRSRRHLCLICGYPHVGVTFDPDEEPSRCPVCGWVDDGEDERTADEVREEVEEAGEVAFNATYSAVDARRNFVAHGHMYRPTDPPASLMAACAEARAHLASLLDRILEVPDADVAALWQQINAEAAEICKQLRPIYAMERQPDRCLPDGLR